MEKKILITGSSGFCGSYLSNYFKENTNEYTVYTTSRTKLNSENHIIHDLSNTILENIFPDNLDCVIHCASEVDQNKTNFDIIENNLRLYYNLLKFTSNSKIQNFINLSSISVYGTQNIPIDEHSKSNPESFYGLSKMFSENLCNFLLPDYVKLIHLRLGYVLGKILPQRYFLTRFKNSIKNNMPITLLNPDTTKFAFIDLNDIANICKISLEKNTHGIFNVVNDDFPSLREVYLEMTSHLSFKKLNCDEKFDKNQESYTKISNRKIKDELGIKFSSYQSSLKNIMN